MLSSSLKAGSVYLAFVFAVGFILGVVRITWLVPLFGSVMAELIEIPIILVLIVPAAGWSVRRFASIHSKIVWLVTGVFALSLPLRTPSHRDSR